MTTKRDPRIDPRPGDVVEKSPYRRIVTDVDTIRIYYLAKNGSPTSSYIENWRKWARFANVITKGNNE